MGTCAGKNKLKLNQEKVQSALSSNWMKISACIDKFSFENSLKSKRYSKYQILFAKNFMRLEIPEEPKGGPPCFSVAFASRFKSIIIKGVPNSRIYEFLFSIFRLSPQLYSEPNARTFLAKETEKLKVFDGAYFGRSKISNNMLSTNGVKSMNIVLHLIREEFPDIQYCPILPRVVQLFLWFVPAKICLKMVTLIIEEHFRTENQTDKVKQSEAKGVIKFLSTSLKYFKFLKKFALSYCKVVEDKRIARKIIETLIDNMCVNVVPLELHSLVFVGYIMSGILFIAALAGNLCSLISDNKSLKIQDLKLICEEKNLYSIILKSHQNIESMIARVDSDESTFSDRFASCIPMINKPSKILLSIERKNLLFSLIPKVYIYVSMKQVFSLQENGLLIKDLNYYWHKECLASLLLIESSNCTYALFLDGEVEFIETGVNASLSQIFIMDQNAAVYKHREGKEIVFQFILNKGILVGEKGKPAIVIDYALLDCAINTGSAFVNGPEAPLEDDFEIYNMELYLMK